VDPPVVVVADALPDAVVGEGGPGDSEAGGGAGGVEGVDGFREVALNVLNEAFSLLDVLLDARFLEHRVDLGVTRLVVLAVGAEAVEGVAALRPVLDRELAEGSATGNATGGRHVGPALELAVAVAEIWYVVLQVIEVDDLAANA